MDKLKYLPEEMHLQNTRQRHGRAQQTARVLAD